MVSAHQALERHCKRFKTQVEAAKALAITAPYMRDLLRGRRDFSANMLAKLGLKRIETIVKDKRTT